MPLNPEEVVNKRFSPTKFRQGYDEEEVDEFLDEVVAELRRLNAENDELRAKLTACESRVSELSRAGSAARREAPGTPCTVPRTLSSDDVMSARLVPRIQAAPTSAC